MANKRNRVITIAAAGTLTVATAISAAAATIPSVGAPAGSSNAFLTSIDSPTANVHVAQSQAMSDATQLHRLHVTAVKAELRANEAAAAKAAAAKKAAAERKAAAAKAAAAAKQAAAQRAAQQRAAQQQATTTSTTTTPSGSPQQIAQQMLGQFGWSSSQFSCLSSLWERESGWNPSAMNPSSGAYGIPQALPGSKMASAGPDWQTNPATQIRWGLQYIQSTYGSPCAAWAHSQADGWY